MQSKPQIGDRDQTQIDAEIPNHDGTCSVQQDPSLAPDGLPTEPPNYVGNDVAAALPTAPIGSHVSAPTTFKPIA